MDYEKAYNEALERAKFYYGNCPSESEKKKLEKLFPELRESEDERIRKEIRNFLIDMECKKEWIAYMEKQKEQKPAWSEEDENALKYIHELISWGYAEKFMDAQTAHDMRAWLYVHLRFDAFQNGNSRPKSSDNWKPSEVCYGAKGDPDPAGVWKPSEEQMEALESAVKLYKDTHFEIHHKKIVSLYEQLKKLTQEG